MDKEVKVADRENISNFVLGGILVLVLIGVLMASAFEVSKTGYAGLLTAFNMTEDTGYFINITINNTYAGTINNITEVNITLPSQCSLNVITNNDTSANGTTGAFHNYSSQILSWRNVSTGQYLMNGSNFSAWFVVNVTCTTPGTYNLSDNITISILNGTGAQAGASVYKTSFNFTVNDTTVPVVTLVAPLSNNTNYSDSFTFNVSVSDNNLLGAKWVNWVNVTIWNASGPVNATYRATNVTNGYFNVTINTSQFNMNNITAVYNITIVVNDTSGNTVTANLSGIKFDNFAPYEVNFTNSSTVTRGVRGNYSNTIVLNFTLLDAISGGKGLYVNITNSSGTQVLWANASNPSGYYWNVSINTNDTYPDDLYNITVYANDSALNDTHSALSGSNINTTLVLQNIRFDNTHPTGSISCTPTSAYVGDTVTCACSVSDVGGSGVNTALTSYTASPSTSDTGTHTQTCSFADLAGNEGTDSTTFVVEQGGSEGSSSGGGSSSSGTEETTWTKTYTIPTTQEASSGYTKELKAKERVELTVSGVSHHVGVKSLTATTAKIVVESTPQEVTFNVGETKKFEVSGDNYYDVKVTLDSIASNKAKVIVQTISELMPATAEEQEGAATIGEGAGGAEAGETGTRSLTWLWVVIAVVLIAVVIGVVVKRRK